jgi:ORF6N domain
MERSRTVIPLTQIERRILTLRGQKVMLDTDLADLYGITTKRLNEQVRRNLGRFPLDFMFQLSTEETSALRSQIATSKLGRGGRRYAPYAFTEHGAIMLANVLNTPRADEVSVYVVRAFVRLRQVGTTNREVATKLAELERRIAGHDNAIRSLVDAIRRLMDAPSPPTRRRIGFRVEEARPGYGRVRRRDEFRMVSPESGGLGPLLILLCRSCAG